MSIVLFGSAAEGRLRPASDVNVIFVLNRFEAARVDGLRDACDWPKPRSGWRR